MVERFIINTETNKGALVDVPENTGTIIASQKRFSSVDSIYIDWCGISKAAIRI